MAFIEIEFAASPSNQGSLNCQAAIFDLNLRSKSSATTIVKSEVFVFLQNYLEDFIIVKHYMRSAG